MMRRSATEKTGPTRSNAPLALIGLSLWLGWNWVVDPSILLRSLSQHRADDPTTFPNLPIARSLFSAVVQAR
jgi:hypothetical protein